MSNHENGRQTGAFRFDKSQWHISDGDLYGLPQAGTLFDRFKTCEACGGSVRYCGILERSWGLGLQGGDRDRRLRWETEMPVLLTSHSVVSVTERATQYLLRNTIGGLGQ